MREQLKYVQLERDEIVIPQSFLLGTTMEYIKLPGDTGFVEGRSSIDGWGCLYKTPAG